MVLQKQAAMKQKGWQEAQVARLGVASRSESAPGDKHQENESNYQASTKS